MTTIPSRKLLPKQTDQYILVENEDQIYIRVDDEYVMKRWFSVAEARTILNIDMDKAVYLCRKLGLQSKANKRKKIRISLTQLRQMAQTKNK